MANRFFNRNPGGLGGLAFRPHDRFVLGAPGNCCGVKTKRTGQPCRQPPGQGLQNAAASSAASAAEDG
jgi:hypothetical protein